MEQPEVPNKSPRSSSSSSSDEKSIDSPKQKPSLPRQYRSKQQSSRDKNSRRGIVAIDTQNAGIVTTEDDRTVLLILNVTSDVIQAVTVTDDLLADTIIGADLDMGVLGHLPTETVSMTNVAGLHDPGLQMPLEPPKPIDPAVAAKEVAAKASAMIASAMSRNLAQSATDANGLPRIDPKDILAKIQETQLAQAKAQAEAAAVAANIPKFYNPLSVNAAKLAEQQQKRKLLWSKKTADTKEDEKSTMWKTTSMVAGKGDSAAAAKFCKLMGIHGTEPPESIALDDQKVAAALDKAQAQADLFRHLEREYENSRTITHTQRGMGLGYSSATHTDYTAYAALAKQRSTADSEDQGDA
ncbi:unnamed protein product [Schistocephalus solidus]|uniref:SMAP domain-containing protein n=1 Tax=Schistocephalus solidus TaxID=70667 RepID=A0A183S974_SCHSO|nr:unnamed protein product [Schistocephalus solidus]